MIFHQYVTISRKQHNTASGIQRSQVTWLAKQTAIETLCVSDETETKTEAAT